jgi:thymidylate synthase
MNSNSQILYDGPLKELHSKLEAEEFFVVNGNKTVEILNSTIEFDSDSGIININDIFKTSNKYLEHEKAWYDSQSLSNEMIVKHAKIWDYCSDENGIVNSNYGFLLHSPQNGYQYKNVVKALNEDLYSRRAIAYYTNPMMHYLGGNDHICTMYVAYLFRDGALNAVVSMRSNDIRFGLIGADLDWQINVLKSLADEIGIKPGKVLWHAASLHLYERHFKQLKEIYE